MKTSLRFIAPLLSLALLLPACGLRQEEVRQYRQAAHRDSLQVIRSQRLGIRSDILRQEALDLRWEVRHYSAPDSAGHQHVERVLTATAQASLREDATHRLQQAEADTLTRTTTSASEERLAAKRTTDRRPAFSSWLATVALALAAGLVIGLRAKRKR